MTEVVVSHGAPEVPPPPPFEATIPDASQHQFAAPGWLPNVETPKNLRPVPPCLSDPDEVTPRCASNAPGVPTATPKVGIDEPTAFPAAPTWTPTVNMGHALAPRVTAEARPVENMDMTPSMPCPPMPIPAMMNPTYPQEQRPMNPPYPQVHQDLGMASSIGSCVVPAPAPPVPPTNIVAWYRVSFLGGLALRGGPCVDSIRTGGMLHHNETFAVSETLHGLDGRIYLLLADGRGWAFDDSALMPHDPSVVRGRWQPAPQPAPVAPEPVPCPAMAYTTPHAPWEYPVCEESEATKKRRRRKRGGVKRNKNKRAEAEGAKPLSEAEADTDEPPDGADTPEADSLHSEVEVEVSA